MLAIVERVSITVSATSVLRRNAVKREFERFMSKRGVIIANTGTPDVPEADVVRAYLAEFLQDPRICPLPAPLWKIILHAFILPKRAHASAEKYRQIWTSQGSPLQSGMASLAHKLQASFNEQDKATLVRHGMSYGSPSIKQALGELKAEGCDELVVLSLYPQNALSTTGVVLMRACCFNPPRLASANEARRLLQCSPALS